MWNPTGFRQIFLVLLPSRVLLCGVKRKAVATFTQYPVIYSEGCLDSTKVIDSVREHLDNLATVQIELKDPWRSYNLKYFLAHRESRVGTMWWWLHLSFLGYLDNYPITQPTTQETLIWGQWNSEEKLSRERLRMERRWRENSFLLPPVESHWGPNSRQEKADVMMNYILL